MKPLHALLLVLVLPACRTSGTDADAAWDGEIRTWGTLREALRDGEDQGRVALADVARPNLYGVGALAGLAGEVTILDGEVWITEGNADSPVSRRVAEGAEATVLFAAEVGEWQAIPVREDVDPSVLDAFLAEEALRAGLDPERTFPFVIEGALSHLHMHVIAGECPMRARMLDADMASPPFEMHADSIEGTLVGIYAPDSSGVVCHHGSQSHVHVALEPDGGLTGHVETVGVAAGATLSLPAR